MILYVDEPATKRNPEIARIARSIFVANQDSIRAYAYDMSVRRANLADLRTPQTREYQSHHTHVIAHAAMNHPEAHQFVVLTDTIFKENAGPKTERPSRWLWISTAIEDTQRCEQSGIWIRCSTEHSHVTKMFSHLRKHAAERTI